MSEETSSALLEQLVYIDNYINAQSGNNTESSNATPNVDVDGQLSLDLAAFADDSFIFHDEDKPKGLFYGDDHNEQHDGEEDEEEDDDEDEVEGDDEEEEEDEVQRAKGKSASKSKAKAKAKAKRKRERENDGLSSWDIQNFNAIAATNFPSHNEVKDETNVFSKHEDGAVGFLQSQNHNHAHTGHEIKSAGATQNILNLNDLPKFPVPPGAKSSLVSAGLSQNQIDLLSALVAQHQTSMGKPIAQGHSQPPAPAQQQPQPRPSRTGPADVDPSLHGIVPSASSTAPFTEPHNRNHHHNHNQNHNHIHHQSPSHIFIAPITPTTSSLSPTDHLTQTQSQFVSQPQVPLLHSQQPNASATSFIDPLMHQQNHNHQLQHQQQHHRNSLSSHQHNQLHQHHQNAPSSVASTSSNISSPDAAELDKKRRNTAASARFRIKKKLKEQQMENKISSLQDLIENLEEKLNNLEMENRLLRNLIIEKGSQKGDDEVKLLKERAKSNQ
ncbi:uncharacterized protein LODBEIA_P50750 [Lodderomyces beijingensis]|uniref:BZIP domain-containing protein n=1 Tax=Lodderomyces beijingensis TaxID=1775926 RepID=A0ABP0ZUP6_9ASCO